MKKTILDDEIAFWMSLLAAVMGCVAINMVGADIKAVPPGPLDLWMRPYGPTEVYEFLGRLGPDLIQVHIRTWWIDQALYIPAYLLAFTGLVYRGLYRLLPEGSLAAKLAISLPLAVALADFAIENVGIGVVLWTYPIHHEWAVYIATIGGLLKWGLVAILAPMMVGGLLARAGRALYRRFFHRS